MTFLHIGRQVPKALRDAGWQEASAMHLGKGCWVIRLERKPVNGQSVSRKQKSNDASRVSSKNSAVPSQGGSRTEAA